MHAYKYKFQETPKKTEETPPVIVKEIYQVGGTLGQGAFGTVYRGLNRKTGEIIAIKSIQRELVKLDKDEQESIDIELELLQKLIHPNIVTFIDYCYTDDYLYFMLEFVEGGNLHDIVKRIGKFSERLLVLYIAQVLTGLDYLHTNGIIHRDIKGANVLLTASGSCKLADFGSCSYSGIVTEEMVGTPFWMSPEVIEQTPAGHGSDIWSLGCTIIELLSGSPPYYRLGREVALYRMVEDDHPPFPPNVSKELQDMMTDCFRRNVKDRPSAEELLASKWIVYNLMRYYPDNEMVKGLLIRSHNRKQLSDNKRSASESNLKKKEPTTAMPRNASLRSPKTDWDDQAVSKSKLRVTSQSGRLEGARSLPKKRSSSTIDTLSTSQFQEFVSTWKEWSKESRAKEKVATPVEFQKTFKRLEEEKTALESRIDFYRDLSAKTFLKMMALSEKVQAITSDGSSDKKLSCGTKCVVKVGKGKGWADAVLLSEDTENGKPAFNVILLNSGEEHRVNAKGLRLPDSSGWGEARAQPCKKGFFRKPF